MVGQGLDTNPAEISPGIFLPHTRYEATMIYGKFKVVLTVRISGGRPMCESMTVSSRDGKPRVTGTTLRDIPLSALLQQSIEGIGFPYSIKDERQVPIGTQTMIDRGKRQPKSVILPMVVDAYREACADPATMNAPTEAVAKRLNYARGHISRLLSEARKTDPPMLGPAQRGKAGEMNRMGADQ